MKRLLGEKIEISRRIMNQASNASGTTHTTITLLDTSSASFSMGGGSSIHSNGEITTGEHADVSNSTTSLSTASSARLSAQVTNKIFNYKDQKDIEYANTLTCEDICFSMCRQLKILPTTRLLFGLRVLDSENEWAVPGFSLRPGVRYCFRMRIKVPNMDTQLKNLDKEAYEYLYWQIRYDIVNEKIPEIRHPEKKDNVMGFAVMDMSIDLEAKSSAAERLEKNYRREIIEKIETNYKRYLPQTLLKEHKYFVKSKICATFKNVREKKIGFTEFKFYYISEVCKLAPNYLMEIYVASVNYIPNDDLLMVRTPTSDRGDSATRVFVRLDTHDHPEPGLKISREKVKWTLLTKIEDIFAICIGGDVCALLEITGLPQGYRMQFGSRTELESFITYISGYSRLTAKWMTDLCANFPTPSLQKLKELKCHGPIGGAFSFAKLRELSLNGATCLVRQCEKEYDVYYIDKSTKTKLEKSLAVDVITTKITRENNKWLLHSNDGVKTFDDLRDLTNSIATKLLWPSEYEKAPLLLICLPKNLQPKKTDTELSDAELRKRKVQIFDRKQDLRWYQNTERLCDNGKIMLVRGDWIQGGVCKDVSVMLKIFLSESNPKEFTDLASFCSQIFSAQFLKLHGLTLTTPYTMVMEYYHGPLDEFLRKYKDEISLQMLISIVYDLARGIEYLRVKNMHHGFIRCSNLYVTKYDPKSNFIETKIGDPGIRRAYSYEDLPWIPQEYYNNPDGVRGDEADEWAFATTIWEIFAYGKRILEELECIGKPKKIVEKLLSNRSRTGGILLKPSESCPEEISNMMFDGWSLDASNRFQTGNIFGTLSTLIGRYRPSYERVFSNEHGDRFLNEDSDNDVDNEYSGDCDAFSNHSTTPFISPNQRISHTGVPGRPYDDTQWVLTLPVGKVIIIKKIGEGHYGTVHSGELRYNDPSTAPEEVAVKLLKSGATSNSKDFLREIKIMQSMNHPNVVKIKYSVQKPISIVMEYVSGGSFLVHLKTSNLSNSKLLHFASDIARGMEYLSSKKIIHRDLATRNILWDKEKDYVKISDFGLAQFANADGYYWGYSQRDIPIKWYSPESIAYNKFSLKSDVWSYGVTMFETFSGGDMPNLVPNRELSQEEFLQRLQLGERLRKPDLCPQIIYEKLMLPCWQADPKARPTFTALLDSIRSILFEGAAI